MKTKTKTMLFALLFVVSTQANELTITGLNKRVEGYSPSIADITIDDLCPQTGKLYLNISETKRNEIEKKLKNELAYFSSAKGLYADLAFDAKSTFQNSVALAGISTTALALLLCKGQCGHGPILPVIGITAGSVKLIDYMTAINEENLLLRKNNPNNKCLDTQNFLKQIRSQMESVHLEYFSGGVISRLKNSIQLGFTQMLGAHLLHYYSKLGEQVSKVETEIVKNSGLQDNIFERFMLTLDDKVCVGKQLDVLYQWDSKEMEGLKELINFSKALGMRVNDQSYIIAQRVTVSYNKEGDIQCAQKIASFIENEIAGSTDYFFSKGVRVNKAKYGDAKTGEWVDGRPGEILVSWP